MASDEVIAELAEEDHDDHGGGEQPQPDNSTQPKPRTAKERAAARWIQRPGESAVPQQFDGVRLKRDELIHGASPEASREIDVSPETTEKYTRFLESYVTNLGKLTEIPSTADPTRSMYDVIMASPQFAHERNIMKMLGTEVLATDGRAISRDMNEAKVKEFLQSADGWAMTTLLMDRQRLLIELGAGMDANIKSLYNKRQPGDKDRTTSTIHRHKTLPNLAKLGLDKTWSGLKVAGFFVGAPGATKIEHRRADDLIEDMQATASPAEVEYLKAMIGVDITKIRRYNGRRVYENSVKPDYKTLEDAYDSNLAAREAFFTELGIDPRNVRSLEDFITNNKGRAENLPLRFYHEVRNEMGKMTLAGRDTFDWMRALGEAERIVLLRYSERRLAQEASGEGTKDVTDLRKKSDALRNRPDELAEKRTKKAEKARNGAEEAKTGLEKSKAELIDPLAAIDNKIGALQVELARDFEIASLPGADFATAIQGRIAALTTEVGRREAAVTSMERAMGRAVLTQLGDVNTRLDAVTSAINAVAAAMAAGGGARGGIHITPPTYDTASLKATVEAQYTASIAERKRLAEETRTRLTELRAKYTTYAQELTKKQESVLKIASVEHGQLASSQQAFDAFTGAGGPPAGPAIPALCTADELRSLPITELAGRLTTGTDAEKFTLALKAKSEAIAQEEERARPIPAYQLTALTELTDPALGLSADDVLIRGIDEIQNAATAAGRPWTPDEVRTRALAAKVAAEQMLITRVSTKTGQEIAHHETIIKEQEKLLKVDFTDAADTVDTAAEVMEQQDRIYTDAGKKVENAAEMGQLCDVTQVTGTDTNYSEPERNAGHERAYYAWLQFLEANYVRAADRGHHFEVLARSLPKDTLIAIIKDELGMDPAFDATQTFTQLENLHRIGRVSQPVLQRVSRRLINHLRDQAFAA